MRPAATELEQAKEWLEQLIRVLVNSGVPRERRDDIAAAVLVALGVAPNVDRCFIRELLLTFSLSSTTCNSAWVSRGFSVIKHV